MTKILQDLIKQLGITAFRISGEQSLEAVSNYPDWLIHLSNNASSALSDNETSLTFERLGDVFPFLTNFLIDAEAFWHNKHSQDKAESGVWTEVDLLGQEYQLEAKALWVNDEKFLLIENVSHNFEERHLVYQKARDMALLNEKLISELNFRQRKLQSDIERHLTLRNPIDELNRTVEGNTSAVLVCLPDGDVELYNKALINIYELGNEKNSSVHRYSTSGSLKRKLITQKFTAYWSLAVTGKASLKHLIQKITKSGLDLVSAQSKMKMVKLAISSASPMT